jgi:hypothetical protein
MMAAVQVDYNGNGECHFGSGNGDYEDGKEYPIQRIGIQVLIAGYKVDVYTIQHELDTHEYGNHITPCKQAIHAYKKQARTDE